uniref:Uncharacterized protein n=1 Tax=Avena sativa TaxID=4498 RepID=A0ACD5VNE9_AVESA
MVAEPLVHKVLSMGKKAKKAGAASGDSGGGRAVGILSFEAANAMSRAADLHRSLSDAEAARLLGPHCLGSRAVRALVPGDDARLLALALAEKLDSLNRVAAVAARLGRRCTAPALQGFDHVYADLFAGRCSAATAAPFAPASSSASALVRQLDRLAAATAGLYAGLDALAGLEQSARKLPTDEARRALEQRARWRRHDLRRLRDASLWNWTYDKAVLLLARAVCAVYRRICLVFGDPMLGLDLLAPSSRQSRQLFSGPITSSARYSAPTRSSNLGQDDAKSGPIAIVTLVDAPRPRPSNCGGNMFMECLSLSSSASWKDGFDEDFSEDASCISTIRSGMLTTPSTTTTMTTPSKFKKSPRFGPKSTVTSLAPPSTIGGSALALHYANIIIIIQKLLQYPHLVGEEARDDLYQMLPSSLRASLRKNLRTYAKSIAIYDAFLAHDWRETLEKTLAWLAPMAHDTMRWQAERNFEQQQIVSKGNVLLLQTLYFADREKTEAVVCELLVGLNYICRYEQQQNALLDCSSSIDFDDCLEWQLH